MCCGAILQARIPTGLIRDRHPERGAQCFDEAFQVVEIELVLADQPVPRVAWADDGQAAQPRCGELVHPACARLVDRSDPPRERARHGGREQRDHER